MYLRFGEDWVGLSEPGAAFGPLSVVVTGLPEAAAGVPARVVGATLIVGRSPVSLERVHERRCMALTHAWAPAGASNAQDARQAAARTLATPPARLRAGVELLGSGEVAAAVAALAGLGDGLTPAGDDVLCGYAAAAVASGRRSHVGVLARGRSSPLGLAYLRAAEQGELPDVGAALMIALLSGSPPKAVAAARGLRSWGASSGTALGWGMLAVPAVAAGPLGHGGR